MNMFPEPEKPTSPKLVQYKPVSSEVARKSIRSLTRKIVARYRRITQLQDEIDYLQEQLERLYKVSGVKRRGKEEPGYKQ
jgi:hypothetical protein